MTTPLEPFDIPREVVRYFINESGLRVNAMTGELIKSNDNTDNKDYENFKRN